MREGGVDVNKGIGNDVGGCAEPGWGRDVKFHEGRDFCLCSGGGVDGSGESGGVDVSSGSSGVEDSRKWNWWWGAL